MSQPTSPAKPPHKFGHVAIIGRPNVGKSTLLNRLLQQKISITSRRPQTTRHRILGIKTNPEWQIAYVDTPGLHLKARKAINRYMNRAADSALHDVEAVVFMLEALKWTDEDDFVADKLSDLPVSIIIAINKVDRVSRKQELLPYIEALKARIKWLDVVPVSAKTGDNIEALEQAVIKQLPAGEAFYPDQQVTDRSLRFLAAEMIREKLMRRLGAELPYRLTVEVETYQEEERLLRLGAVIWVERKSHKSIVIGNQGQVLKKVGMEARKDLQDMVQKKVFLQTWVKIKENWSDDDRILRSFGYDEH